MQGDFLQHKDYMIEALALAKQAAVHDDVPVGAIVVKDGAIIGRGENRREVDKDPSGHAEIIAIREAAKALDSWNLSGCQLYVTLEPCPMCAGAIIQSRLDAVYFGAFDGIAGCCGSVYNLPADERFHHRAKVVGGILRKECVELLKQFFIHKRKTYSLY